MGGKLVGKRKTGSNYLSAKGTEGLVTGKKTLPLDNVGVAYGGVAQANRIVAASASGLGQPVVAAGAGVLGGALSCVAPVLSVAGALVAAEGLSSLMSDQDKAKANVLHGVNDAGRFWHYLAEANSEEADLFLDFDQSALKVFKPTKKELAETKEFNPIKKELAEMNGAKAGAANQVVQQVASAVSAGAAITSLAAPAVAIAAPAAAVLAPLAAVGGGIDVYKGVQEHLRQSDQKQWAEQRKTAMDKVLKEVNEEHPDYPLLVGIVHSLAGWQDKVIRQMEREKGFAETHIFTGGGAVGGMTALGVTACLVLGSVVVAPLLGPAGIIAAVPGLVWGGVAAKRGYEQHRIEHKSKWRQRAARVLGFEMSREELEQKLAGTHENDSRLHVAFQEGEYLPEKEPFAGSREMDFDARDNEYLGLHALALRVQDLVLKGGGYDPQSPFMKLLEAVGIDAIRLLAICKAASARPADMQLDYIKSRIAPRLDIKMRMQGELQQEQALPHVSVFLGHFRKALSTVRERYKEGGGSADLHAEIREDLGKLYPDPQAGLQAFDSAIGTFLAKVQSQNLPETPFLKMLKGFADYSAQLPAEQLAAKKTAAEEAQRLVFQQMADATTLVAKATPPTSGA
ncbi:hypothetical protein C7T35_38285 [Variovorax sp. WS11]|uniref:hypothetical protein n=1 Tax=Variovorax sp. WS11 TaxID=1105204 RepID=UPI000D0D7984|nr:hypothetical protein [Variovorax sp. WS11]NDZ13970.1 hypothetical protein [Variovorax sp. WS11]PSL79314.1 hypothetical protein C7T35_38285 [Variovorax sp. WS11]